MSPWLLAALALGGGRTVTATTLVRSVGVVHTLAPVRGGSEDGWTAACAATDPSTLACSLYDPNGGLQARWALAEVRGDVVVFEAARGEGGRRMVTLRDAATVFHAVSPASVAPR